MFTNEVYCNIATLISPSALIKLSLCSKAMRKLILKKDRIWRAQYFREWSCAFPFEDRNSKHNLFPAPTWLKSFILRKLAEENLYNDSGVEMQSAFIDENYYNFFVNDLVFSVGYKDLDVFTGLNPSEELTYFLPDREILYSLYRYPMIGWDSNFVIAAKERMFIFSEQIQEKYEMHSVRDLIPVDSSSFLAKKDSDRYYLFNIDEEITEDLFIEGCRMCKVHGIEGRVVSVSKKESSGFTWKYCNIGNGKQEEIYCGKVLEKELKEGFKLGHFIADTDFLFISYYIPSVPFREYNIYVYSFSTKKHRVFKMEKVHCDAKVVILYASKWNNIQANHYVDKNNIALALFSGSFTLESLTLKTVEISSFGLTNITQLSRRLLFVSSCSPVEGPFTSSEAIYLRLLLKFEHSSKDIMIDTETGEILWKKNYSIPFELCNGLSNICSRFYCARSKRVMDFKPKKNPKVGKWLYSIFDKE